MKMLKSKADLVSKAIKKADIYCAAAVYEIANTNERNDLECLMFSKRRDALSLARWEHTPASVLQALSENVLRNSDIANVDSAILTRIEKNPNTPSLALSQHYKSEKYKKQKLSFIALVAEHQNTPLQILESIARFENDIEGLKSLSRNISANASVLTILVSRIPNIFDKNVAAHPSASANLLELIYARGNAYTRAAIIGHKNCPLCLVESAEQNGDLPLLMLRQLAKDERLSKNTLIKLSSNIDSVVRYGIACNLATPKAVLSSLSHDSSAAVRRAIASRFDLTITSIIVLMKDKDVWVRQWLARNLRVPKKLLEQLAQDKHADVRRAVARNPRCPIVVLDLLAQDESAWVRSAVAYQKKTPRRLMQLLAGDTNIDVLSGVANNRHTPQKILQKLALSAEEDIRRGVIINLNATRKTMLPLLEDSYYLHRLMLIKKPQLNQKDIWRLCDDPDFQVRFMAFRHIAHKLLVNSAQE